MRAQRAPLRPTFSPARLCHVVYAGFSGGQMEDYPCVGQHISRRKNARRLSPSDLRTTLPDLRALAKRPLASPHRAANWRRSVDFRLLYFVRCRCPKGRGQTQLSPQKDTRLPNPSRDFLQRQKSARCTSLLVAYPVDSGSSRVLD